MGFQEKTRFVEEPDLCGGLLFSLSTLDNSVSELIRNSCPCCPSPKNKNPLVFHFYLRDPGCRHDGCHRDYAGSLDIIIKTRQLGTVLFENPSCVGESEVLEV